MLADTVSRRLLYAIAGVVIVWLAWLASALALGVIGPPPEAPRTDAERALRIYGAQVEAGSTDVRVWSGYAGVLVATGQYAKAEQTLEAALAAFTEGRSHLLVEKARLAQVRGRHVDAVLHADETLASATHERDIERVQLAATGAMMEAGLPPAYARALLIKAESLVALDRLPAAIEAYDDFLEMHPAAANVLVSRGDVRAAHGDTAGAARDYRAALRFVPDDTAAHEGLERIGESADDR